VIDSRKRTSERRPSLTLLVIAVVVINRPGNLRVPIRAGRIARRLDSGWRRRRRQTPQQIVLKLRTAYQTVTLHYRSETLTLDPQRLISGWTRPPHSNRLLTSARRRGRKGSCSSWSRRTAAAQCFPSWRPIRRKLRALLTRVAERYDQAPTSPARCWTIALCASQPGNELDISSSVPSCQLRSARPTSVRPPRRQAVPPISPRLRLCAT